MLRSLMMCLTECPGCIRLQGEFGEMNDLKAKTENLEAKVGNPETITRLKKKKATSSILFSCELAMKRNHLIIYMYLFCSIVLSFRHLAFLAREGASMSARVLLSYHPCQTRRQWLLPQDVESLSTLSSHSVEKAKQLESARFRRGASENLQTSKFSQIQSSSRVLASRGCGSNLLLKLELKL